MSTHKKARKDKERKKHGSSRADYAGQADSGVQTSATQGGAEYSATESGKVASHMDKQHKARAAVSAASSTSGSKNPFGSSSVIIGIVVALTIGVYAGTLFNSSGPSTVPAGQQSAASGSAAPAPAPVSSGDMARILELEQVVLKNANDLAAWIQLGNLYFDTSKPRDAIRAYEKALSIKPDNADVLTDLGIMYRETGQFDRAVDSFRKAVALRPGHQNAMFNTGIVLYFDLGRKDEALKVWRELVAVNPGAKAPDGQLVRDMIEKL